MENLLLTKQFALLEQLVVDEEESFEVHFFHLSALFGLKKFHKLIDLSDIAANTHPEWFLSPVGDHVADLQLLRLKALVEVGSGAEAAEQAKTYFETIVSKSVLEDAASLKSGSSELLSGALGEDTRVALSDIAYLLSKLHKNESLKFALVAIRFNQANITAWHDVLSGWSLSEAEKLDLVKTFQWEKFGSVLRIINGWSFLDSTPPESTSVDPVRRNQALRKHLFLGESDKVFQTVRHVKSHDHLLCDIDSAPLAAAALYLQNDSITLLKIANKLLNSQSHNPDSFFVAGVYYMSIQRFDVARKFLSKATNSAHGWIAHGLALSFSDESVHAINAFRTATRLFPKCLLPWLYMGMEYVRTNELKLAQSYLVSALALCGPDNPRNENRFRALILNEIGIICLKAEQFDIAAENLRICCAGSDPSSAIFFSNLGYALVKVRDIEAAGRAFETSVSLNRSNGNALAGVGFCFHCKGSLARAIDMYNAALPLVSGNRKTENLINNLIQLAVNEYSFSVRQTNLASSPKPEPMLLSF